MELIVAVYDDWGIGCCGTQPVALSADRKFFREQTRGAMVIVGRKTLGDFPGGKPLPNRVNVVLSRGTVACDTYFPNLDKDPQWCLTEVLQSGEENGISYEMCIYKRI